MIAFGLQSNGKYQQIEISIILSGLPISLLSQTLEQMNEGNNINAALWFSQQIAKFELNQGN